MSKYQALIDALNGDDSLFSNVRNGDVRALLADLERAEKALKEVVAVFDSNPSSIVDTVWVTGNRPETLYDHCQDALGQKCLTQTSRTTSGKWPMQPGSTRFFGVLTKTRSQRLTSASNHSGPDFWSL